MDGDTRVVDCVGIHNFRDYGGYRVAGGGRLRRGMLYRSAQHRDATRADLEQVGRIGFDAVIDLRGFKERRASPCPRPAGFSARVILIDEETVHRAPHEDAGEGVRTVEEAHDAMRQTYRILPFGSVLQRLFSAYFEALSEAQGPTLIHCMAGKDRTGIGVALLHHLAGVHRDDMMADYLLTNEAGNVEARIAAGAQSVRKLFGRNMDEAAVRTLMMVEPSYLEAAFDEMAQRYGSIEGYMHDCLGVTAERADTIRGKLIA